MPEAALKQMLTVNSDLENYLFSFYHSNGLSLCHKPKRSDTNFLDFNETEAELPCLPQLIAGLLC